MIILRQVYLAHGPAENWPDGNLFRGDDMRGTHHTWKL